MFTRWDFWLVLLVFLAAVLGTVLLTSQHMRLQTDGFDPEPTVTVAVAPSPEPSRTKNSKATPEPTETKKKSKKPRKTSKTPDPVVVERTAAVHVYNNSRVTGLARRTAEQARALGWNVPVVANWRGQVATSTVYHPSALTAQAELLAEDLGIANVAPAAAGMTQDALTVVLRQ